MQIIYTELKNTLEYICSINVFDTQMLMRVSYNSRSKKRLISLTSLDESVLFLKPTYITEGSRVFPNINAKLNGLSFYITLNPLSFSGENYKDWANQYQLCFVEYAPYTNLTTNRFYSDIFVSDDDTSVTPSFGDWVVTNVEIVNQDIKYFCEKTNTIDIYDSYALYPLEQALVNSFHDVDMQQCTAFTSAVDQLIDAVEWVVDTENNQIVYTEPPKPIDPHDPTVQYFYHITNSYGQYFEAISPQDTCRLYIESMGMVYDGVVKDALGNFVSCEGHRPPSDSVYSFGNLTKELNPNYDPDAEPVEAEEKYLPLPTVAQQVISNSISTSIDEVLKMLSEDYINLVANSVLNTNENKQFVKLDELKIQLEQNKTLRS